MFTVVFANFHRKYSLFISFVKQKIKKSEEFHEKKLVNRPFYAQ